MLAYSTTQDHDGCRCPSRVCFFPSLPSTSPGLLCRTARLEADCLGLNAHYSLLRCCSPFSISTVDHRHPAPSIQPRPLPPCKHHCHPPLAATQPQYCRRQHTSIRPTPSKRLHARIIPRLAPGSYLEFCLYTCVSRPRVTIRRL
jgi:hypothetical protein